MPHFVRVTLLAFFASTICVADEVPVRTMTWSLRDEFRTGAARENPNSDREDQPVWDYLRTNRSEGPVETRKWLRDGKYVPLADEGENLFGSPLNGWAFRAKEPLAPAIGKVTAEYDIGLKKKRQSCSARDLRLRKYKCSVLRFRPILRKISAWHGES